MNSRKRRRDLNQWAKRMVDIATITPMPSTADTLGGEGGRDTLFGSGGDDNLQGGAGKVRWMAVLEPTRSTVAAESIRRAI